MFSVALLLLFTAGSWVQGEQLTQPPSQTVQPGQRLTITCQVSYSVASYYTGWIRQPAGGTLEWIGHKWTTYSYYKDSLKSKFRIDDNTSNNRVTLTGENMQPGDSAVYYCARYGPEISLFGVRYYFDYWGQGTTVTVTSAAEKAPSVFPLLPCDLGTGDITLSCLATGFSPSSLTFAWKKGDTDMTDLIKYPDIKNGNDFTGISQVKVRRQDWESKQYFYCITTHSTGEEMASLYKQEVFYNLPTLNLLASSNEAFFACFANDFSPNNFEFKWLKNDQEVTTKKAEITSASQAKDGTNGKLYSATSFLSVEPSELSENAKFTCEFKGRGESGDQYVNASVTPSIVSHPASANDCPEKDQRDLYMEIVPPKPEDLLIHKEGSVICEVHIKTKGVTRVFWKGVANSFIEPGEDTTGKISLKMDITFAEWTAGVDRICVVKHSTLGEFTKEYKRAAEKMNRPAVFMLAPVEQSQTGMVTLTCFVKDFYPEDVIVTWLVDDVPVDPINYQASSTKPVQNNGLYLAYSQLSFNVDLWSKSGVEYSCVVYHESVVHTTKAIVRSIGSKSVEKVNMVNLNMNLPDQCKTQ